jgi:Ca2+-binding RTX toxin-like protein
MAIPIADSVPLLTRSNNHNGTLTEEFISGLVQGGSWTFGDGPRTLTYSFDLNFDGPAEAFTQGWMTAIDKAFQAWENVANIKFSGFGTPNAVAQNLSEADIAIALSPEGRDGVAGIGIFPDPDVGDRILESLGYSRTGGQFPAPRIEGDITFNSNHFIFDNLAVGGRGFYVMLHEIGHALGLKHTDDNGLNGRPTFDRLGILRYDTPQYTVMEGRDFPLGKVPSTPMLADILAIQHIYGANMSYHTGNDTYRLNNNSFQAIWDAGGRDTIAAGPMASFINLKDGTFSGSSSGARTTGIAYNVNIENATGSQYGDMLFGNDLRNVLNGLGGNDTLNGRGGLDTLRGGAGDDLYILESASTVVIEQIGRDTIRAKFDYALGAGFENLDYSGAGSTELTGIGNGLANRIVASHGDCVLEGRGGNDTLQGGRGNDMLLGGTGVDVVSDWGGADVFVLDRTEEIAFLRNPHAFDRDTLIFDSPVDVLWEINFSQRNFRGFSTVNVAGAGRAKVRGYVGNDTFIGGGGNDSLFGAEGLDSLLGGDGDDRLDGGNDSDRLDGGGGNDVLIGGTSGDTLYGGAGDDRLDGGAGNDWLEGGDGLDTMAGGEGDDSYLVGSQEELALLIELAGGGSDTVVFDLADGSYVLSLDGVSEVDHIAASGNGDLSLTGNVLGNRLGGGGGNDTLIGLDGADSLSGGNGEDFALGGEGNDTLIGGAGVDTLVGADGDDTYLVRDELGIDVVMEADGQGIDTLVLELAFSDGAPAVTVDVNGLGSFEIIDARSSNREFSITGSGGDDTIAGGLRSATIAGGAGHDSILGGNSGVIEGEEGNDTIQGGFGRDTIDGGDGHDWILGGSGADIVYGGMGDDTISSTNEGQDTVYGGAGNDYLMTNGTGNTLLDGGEGDDNVMGFTFTDTVIGGAGNDTLEGGRISAGEGDDFLKLIQSVALPSIDGGAGNDAVDLRLCFLTIFDLAQNFAGVEAIQMAAGDTLTVTEQSLLDVSDTDVLRIDGEAGSALNVTEGTWNDLGETGGYHVYTLGAARLEVVTGVIVSIDVA